MIALRAGGDARRRARSAWQAIKETVYALQHGDDADAYAPMWPAVPLLRLPRDEPQGSRHLPGALEIAASEVEALVLGRVRLLLASPELVGRTITAVRS